MSRLKKVLGIAGLAIFTTAMAWAADDDGNFAVDGRGSVACSQFVEDLADETARTAYANFTAGFLTGVNVFAAETFDITPWQPPTLVLRQLQTYCEANPDVRFVNALGRLTAFLEPNRLTRQSELVQIRNDGKAVVAYRDVLDRVAASLVATGHADAPGALTAPEALSTALSAYQRRTGLPDTGLPDIPTLLQLLR